jgi:aspartate ammonia-lyase
MVHRSEEDFLGSVAVPAGAHWGIHTQRALSNFAVSGTRVHPGLVRAFAAVKKACCQANRDLGWLPREKADAIIQACDEVAAGGLSDQFPVDALQGGAGTSTNMNVNEVVANRAIEILGGTKGQYDLVHPIDDVNRNQSTNDTYPTALKVAAIRGLRGLSAEIAGLQGAFQAKEKEFAAIVKMGRTELQEAVPITLGAELGAFAEAFSRDRWRTFKCEERLRVVNLGGTAVGTGITAPRSYIFLVTDKLREATGLGLSRGENLLDQTANTDVFVEVSGILDAHASNLVKICGDLRTLNLLGEIRLPRLQAGSSIMPGKVNPVILEMAMQVGMKVSANHGLVTAACSRASLQINEFLPLVAASLLESLDLLARADAALAVHVREIGADPAACRAFFEKSPMIVTALVPYVGYEKAAALLAEHAAGGRGTLLEFLSERLGGDLIGSVFSPQKLLSLGHTEDPA